MPITSEDGHYDALWPRSPRRVTKKALARRLDTLEGKTLGTPIAIVVRNEDARPEAYRELKETFRPSHADFTYQAKYGIRNWQGGGRASARETIGRVAAGAVAAQSRQAWRRVG